MRDHYQILDVPRTASPEAIRLAHRRLVRQFHPDVNKAPDAEELFRLVQEAFEVLSDPERRALLDRYLDGKLVPAPDRRARTGSAGGEGVGRSPARPSRRGAGDREVSIHVDPAALPTVQTIVYRRLDVCPGCAGGMRRSAPTCPTCGSTGRAESECRLRVRIPPGVRDGAVLLVPGRGDVAAPGHSIGNLRITVWVVPRSQAVPPRAATADCGDDDAVEWLALQLDELGREPPAGPTAGKRSTRRNTLLDPAGRLSWLPRTLCYASAAAVIAVVVTNLVQWHLAGEITLWPLVGVITLAGFAWGLGNAVRLFRYP